MNDAFFQSWFITIDNPKIKIRNHIIKQFKELEVDDLIEESISAQAIDDISKLLMQSKRQYLKEDDKWVISLARYLMENGYFLLKNRKYNESIKYYLDALYLHEIQRDKYIQRKNKDLLRKCGVFTDLCKLSINFACGSSIINLMPEIDFQKFKKDLLPELKKVGLSRLDDDEVIIAFLGSIRFFGHKIGVNKYMDIINKLNISNEIHWEYIIHFLISRKKLLSKKIFEKWSAKPVIDKKYLAELCACQTYLAQYYEKLNDKKNGMLELADGYKFKAYMTDGVEESKKLFDNSIKLLELVKLYHPNDETQRDLLFAKARRAEYLAFRYDELKSRIKYLKVAQKYFSRLKDPRSYLAEFFQSYYKMKKYIVEDDKFRRGVEFARGIIANENNINILIGKYPDIQQLIFICSLIDHFPVKTPKEPELKKLNDMQYNITISWQRLKPLWEIIYSYNLLKRSVGDNKELNKFFKEAIATFLQSGTSLEMEEIAGRLFFSEPTEKVSQEFIEYLRKEEGQNLEFKASFNLDVSAFLFSGKTKYRDELKDEVLKTIVGFLNSSGGSMILGVLEKRKDFLKFKDQLDDKFNKYIFGVEREYKSDGYDGYIRRIEDILRERIDSNLPSLLKIQKYSLSDHDLIHFIIPKTERWYYLDNEIFYVREHNQTINKKGADADEYKHLNPR